MEIEADLGESESSRLKETLTILKLILDKLEDGFIWGRAYKSVGSNMKTVFMAYIIHPNAAFNVTRNPTLYGLWITGSAGYSLILTSSYLSPSLV